VRVQAVNTFGPGLASPTEELKVNAAIMIKDLPEVDQPKLVQRTDTTLVISWKHNLKPFDK
jgi:hypothetical protein